MGSMEKVTEIAAPFTVEDLQAALSKQPKGAEVFSQKASSNTTPAAAAYFSALNDKPCPKEVLNAESTGTGGGQNLVPSRRSIKAKELVIPAFRPLGSEMPKDPNSDPRGQDGHAPPRSKPTESRYPSVGCAIPHHGRGRLETVDSLAQAKTTPFAQGTITNYRDFKAPCVIDLTETSPSPTTKVRDDLSRKRKIEHQQLQKRTTNPSPPSFKRRPCPEPEQDRSLEIDTGNENGFRSQARAPSVTKPRDTNIPPSVQDSWYRSAVNESIASPTHTLPKPAINPAGDTIPREKPRLDRTTGQQKKVEKRLERLRSQLRGQHPNWMPGQIELAVLKLSKSWNNRTPKTDLPHFKRAEQDGTLQQASGISNPRVSAVKALDGKEIAIWTVFIIRRAAGAHGKSTTSRADSFVDVHQAEICAKAKFTRLTSPGKLVKTARLDYMQPDGLFRGIIELTNGSFIDLQVQKESRISGDLTNLLRGMDVPEDILEPYGKRFDVVRVDCVVRNDDEMNAVDHALAGINDGYQESIRAQSTPLHCSSPTVSSPDANASTASDTDLEPDSGASSHEESRQRSSSTPASSQPSLSSPRTVSFEPSHPRRPSADHGIFDLIHHDFAVLSTSTDRKQANLNAIAAARKHWYPRILRIDAVTLHSNTTVPSLNREAVADDLSTRCVELAFSTDSVKDSDRHAWPFYASKIWVQEGRIEGPIELGGLLTVGTGVGDADGDGIEKRSDDVKDERREEAKDEMERMGEEEMQRGKQMLKVDEEESEVSEEE